jgi:LuxR family maltose regulon positive regulatory protein
MSASSYYLPVKSSLESSFRNAWENCRIILFSAPCGCGKTATAHTLLRGTAVCEFNAGDTDFSPDRITAKYKAVLVDDLQYLRESEQQALCSIIRSFPDLHFVLLSRGRVPGWLMPFDLSGMMTVFYTEDLLFDIETSRKMMVSRGISLTVDELSAIFRDINGYPLGMEFVCRSLSDGRPYDSDVLTAVKRDLFSYYDEAVLHRFPVSVRSFLLYLAPFEHFDIELARMISGEEHAGEMLGAILRDTSMLLFDGTDTYRFWPIFQEFLLWEFDQTMTATDRTGVYSRAALYYELHGEYEHSLDFYSRAGESDRISSLLIKNAELHPGIGHYREMQDYYFALPRETVLRSPSLMCGMSMLTALTIDYAASEQWYRELENYASSLKKNDREYRDVRAKLAYLDIALPQRGSKDLISVITGVFHIMLDKNIEIPAFSVTSMLPSIMNGGKDFCEWSKRDDILYATMRAPVESVLGRDGIGTPDCAICESKFEKGENISSRMLTLMSRLSEIQSRGTPDIEFAAIGLLARIQVSQGKAEEALQSVESLREKYEKTGETRFIGNIDALLTRIRLRLADTASVYSWLDTEAPKNDARLWAMWRYQYLTRAMAQLSIGETEEPLLMLARLKPYCETCGRVMDALHIRIISSICRYRRQDPAWVDEFSAVLDTSSEYNFIWPVAQYGAAVLPLLRGNSWNGSRTFLDDLCLAAKKQAVFYPHFLKPSARLVAPLSETEMQVLRLLCQGLGNQEIGDILDIKLATVKTHVSHILQKLNVRNRSEAGKAAAEMRLI